MSLFDQQCARSVPELIPVRTLNPGWRMRTTLRNMPAPKVIQGERPCRYPIVHPFCQYTRKDLRTKNIPTVTERRRQGGSMRHIPPTSGRQGGSMRHIPPNLRETGRLYAPHSLLPSGRQGGSMRLIPPYIHQGIPQGV